MTTKKLKKYLAYYQKTLHEEPENIEARLRLAAVFRDMGRYGHAIEEYGTASRLLARQGLALEAIAACKAILELDPLHTETQLFLARMYARSPDAAGPAARIARPLAPSEPLALGQPLKPQGAAVEPPASPESDDLPTLPPARPALGRTVVGPSPEEPTAVRAHDAEVYRLFFAKNNAGGPAPAPHAADAQPEPTMILAQPSAELLADARRNGVAAPVEDAPLSELRRTMDLGEEDILLEEMVDEEPITSELDAPSSAYVETFPAGVFDMDSLRLEREASGRWDELRFLEDIEEPNTAELNLATHLGIGADEEPPVLSVRRAEQPRIPLFSQLDPAAFTRLLTLMDYRVLAADSPVIDSGRLESSLFVVVSGRVAVERTLSDGSVIALAEMGEGEFFGEFALLTGRSESASVRTIQPTTLLEVRREVLKLIALEHPEIWDILWDFYYARVLNNLLATSSMFRSLDAEARHALAARFVLREVPEGTLLARQGQHADDLYVICLGEVQVERRVGSQPPVVIDTLGEGEFVGLISSAAREPVVADLLATRDTTLLVLPGEEFRLVMQRTPQVAYEVQAIVRHRRERAAQYARGATSYAELGLAAPWGGVADSR